MQNFLDKYTTRKMKLIDILLSENRHWSLNELTAVLHCSKKTVQADIKNLKNDLIPWRNEIQLFSSSKGYFLAKSAHFNSHLLKIDYLTTSTSFSLFNRLFLGELTSFTQFSKEQFISYSSMNKEINLLKKDLFCYELSISANPPKLKGSETQIRYYAQQFYWTNYSGLSWPFNSTSREVVISLVSEIEKLLEHPFNLMEREQMAYWIAISRSRLNKGCPLEDNAAFQYLDCNEPLDLALIQLYQALFADIELSTKQLSLEINFLYSLLYLIPSVTHSTKLVKKILTSYQKLQPIYYQATQLVLTNFPTFFRQDKLNPPNALLTFNLTKIHYQAFLFVDNDPYSDTNQLMGLTQETQVNISRLYDQFYASIKENSQLKRIFQQKKLILTLYTPLLIPFLDRRQSERKLGIKIISSNGRLYEQQLKSYIQNYFNYNIEIIPSFSEEQQIDLIISDSMISQDISTFIWSAAPTPGDLERLDSVLAALVRRNSPISSYP